MDAVTAMRLGSLPSLDRAAAPLLMGVELGGTKIDCILGRGPGAVVDVRRIDTSTPDRSLGQVEAILTDWQADFPEVAALGIASFGPADVDVRSPRYGSILRTTKLGWEGAAIVPRLTAALGLPIRFDTDVNGAAIAEGLWGAARGVRNWAYITVGTGIGVGLVVDGRPVSGLSHAEPGHMLIRRMAGDRWPGSCPFHDDCVEGLASGPAIAARAGRSADMIADDDAVWHPVAHAIAGLVHNLAVTATPELVLLGGGVPAKRPHLLGLVRSLLHDSLAGYVGPLADRGGIDRYLVPPGLGERAGPLGALALVADLAAGARS